MKPMEPNPVAARLSRGLERSFLHRCGELAQGLDGLTLLLLAQQARVERQVSVRFHRPFSEYVAPCALLARELVAKVGAKMVSVAAAARRHPPLVALVTALIRSGGGRCGGRVRLLLLRLARARHGALGEPASLLRLLHPPAARAPDLILGLLLHPVHRDHVGGAPAFADDQLPTLGVHTHGPLIRRRLGRRPARRALRPRLREAGRVHVRAGRVASAPLAARRPPEIAQIAIWQHRRREQVESCGGARLISPRALECGAPERPRGRSTPLAPGGTRVAADLAAVLAALVLATLVATLVGISCLLLK